MGPFVLKVADYSAMRGTKKLITFWVLNFLQTLSLKQETKFKCLKSLQNY